MINNLTITQLVENTAGDPGLLAEHGVAFFVEADGHRLLFDTGQGLALAHNTAQMNIPMETVEAIILIHGHYDHAGGLVSALEMTGPADVYFHPQALKEKFNRNGRMIGASIVHEEKLASLANECIYTRSPTEIISGIHVTGEIPRKHKIEDTGGPFYLDPDRTREDVLADDQALFIETPKGQACLRPRDRFWDIPVPKIDSAFDNLLVPQLSWSPSTTQQLRKLVAAPYLAPI